MTFCSQEQVLFINSTMDGGIELVNKICEVVLAFKYLILQNYWISMQQIQIRAIAKPKLTKIQRLILKIGCDRSAPLVWGKNLSLDVAYFCIAFSTTQVCFFHIFKSNSASVMYFYLYTCIYLLNQIQPAQLGRGRPIHLAPKQTSTSKTHFGKQDNSHQIFKAICIRLSNFEQNKDQFQVVAKHCVECQDAFEIKTLTSNIQSYFKLDSQNIV